MAWGVPDEGRSRAGADEGSQRAGTQTYVPPANVTFREYATETWWPHVEETRRPSTVDSYRRMLAKHIYPVIGSVPLQKFGPSDVDRVYREAAENGLEAEHHPRDRGDRLRGSLYAKRKGLVLHNVAENSDPPKAVRPQRTIWTARETARFLEAVEDDRLHALWRLLVVTGVRRGEVCGLTWLNVDLEAGTVTIAQQTRPGRRRTRLPATEDRSGAAHGPDRRRNGRRAQAPPRDAAVRASGHREIPRIDRDLVFTRLDGEPLNPRALSQAFQVRRKNAGLPHVRLHDLRHGAATLALEGDVNLELIRRRMGHAHISTTIDLYARHEIESSERAAADTVADLVDSRLQGVSKERAPQG